MKNKFVEIVVIIEDDAGIEHVVEKRVPVRESKAGERRTGNSKAKPVDLTPPKTRRRKAS